MPAGAINHAAVVTLAAVETPLDAPVPRSILGRAYQFSVEDADLTGIAVLKLPLPAAISADQYEIGAYRWNGRAWERMTGRLTGQTIQLGTNAAGIFSLQGQWRLADAVMALAIPAVEASRQTRTIVVAGQYRYTALPTLQHDYVPARLTLKRDSSGGAGQVLGDETLDETIDETLLWFKPDPAFSEGVIEFSHVFEIAPGKVNVAPGATGQLYATLTVEDAVAPTRRFSAGGEYRQVLPLQIVGLAVVRPALELPALPPLRWHVRFNGATLLQEPAAALSLPLSDTLALVGVGEYRIVLEAQVEGQWTSVSNEVTVELRLPATATPLPTPTSRSSATPVATPAAGVAPPTVPATPTRRPTPGERTATPAAATPTSTAGAPTPTPTGTRPVWASLFWADAYTLAPGQCTMLHWNVTDVTGVYLNDAPATGREDRQICPAATTTYVLRTTGSAGQQARNITITVQTVGAVGVEFRADQYTITEGKCTTLRWRATDVLAVYLDDEGVAGEATRQVCPVMSTTYTLQVNVRGADPLFKDVTIEVVAKDEIIIQLWAEQYTLKPGSCTTLRWSVQDVQAVYLELNAPEEGVPGVGSRQVCPAGAEFYTIRAITADNRSASKEIRVEAANPTLAADEVIAQGIVKEVTMVTDVDPGVVGEQPGWSVLVDGVNALFVGASGCCQTVVSLIVAEDQASELLSEVVNWPVNPGQLIEYRARCANNNCTLRNDFYLKLRSQ